jgi:hypothetical protein
MATHTITYSTTTPANTALAGNGAQEIRNTRIAVKERLNLDHYMTGKLDTADPKCEGFHKKVTLAYYTNHASVVVPAGSGVLYAYSANSGTTISLYWKNASGSVKIV